MKHEFVIQDNIFNINTKNIQLLIIIFFAAVLAKGAVIFPGFAIDDYPFESATDFGNYFSQGRYILSAIVWVVDSFGVNITDLYFSLGIVALFLQATLVMAIFRFVGIAASPGAALVGAIMVSHPYLAESLTFRMGLPGYCIALIFAIISLENITKDAIAWRTRLLAFIATFAMLFIYQILLNYYIVAIIFAFLMGLVLRNGSDKSLFKNNIYHERAAALAIISIMSAIAFLAIFRLGNILGISAITSRAVMIDAGTIPERMAQLSSFLINTYWLSEPIFFGWLKALVALMLLVSMGIIFFHVLTQNSSKNRIYSVLLVIIVFLVLILVSPGLILAFKDWWPVPRVVAHISIIIGLIFLVADSCIPILQNVILKLFILVSRFLVLIGFIFLSNQIFADQQRLNRWDDMMANRIISRLEMQPNFINTRLVYINGGSYGYPEKLRTMNGDMNISAFFPASSKIHLLSHVSGYKFDMANGPKAETGEIYCKTKQPWPHAESVIVDNDLIIICLKK